MPDKYDEAIEFLTAHPDQIEKAWAEPSTAPGGCLFAYASLDLEYKDGIGCLTQIRRDYSADIHLLYGKREAFDPIITAQIQQDTRLPVSPAHITAESLLVFAEYQRKLDEARLRFNHGQ